MKRLQMLPTVSLLVIVLVATGCQTEGQGTATGALSGAALGAGTNALLSRHSGNGAIIGGLAGAAAGGLIGNQMGRQNENIRAQDQRMDRQDQAIGQAQQDANTAIVNVPTSTGGVKPVKMIRQGGVWIGPNGEYYNSLPSAEQLRSAYGF